MRGRKTKMASPQFLRFPGYWKKNAAEASKREGALMLDYTDDG